MKGMIGILGGMGPAATVDIFNKLVNLTAAGKDQDHIPVLISSIPDIPDRTQSLLHGGESPLNAMTQYMHILEQGGAECIVVACNTAHYWYPDLKQRSSVEMISIIDCAIEEIVASGMKKIGLLATDATLATGLYQKEIEARGLTCLVPNEHSQQSVMESIYTLKAGNAELAEQMMCKQADKLLARGAEVLIMGCTEIPIILAKQAKHHPESYIDSTAALVRSTVRWYEKRTGRQVMKA